MSRSNSATCPAAERQRHRFEGARLRLPVLEVRLRDAHPLTLLVDLEELNDALGAWVRQWLEQNTVHDAEDRRRRADPECEGQNGDSEKAGAARERSRDESKVSLESFHERDV